MIQTLPQPDAVARWLHATVTGTLRCDSRQLQPGDGFIAWPGAATDGRRFVAGALAAGAAAAVVEREGLEAFDLNDGRVLAVPGLKAQAGAVAAAFFGHPSHQLDMVAFTGTNGKTSSAWWMAQLLDACDRPCGLVGTLGIGRPGRSVVPTGLTTPDPVQLQRSLRTFVDEGLQACAIEASSIGLVEQRLDATRMSVAVFTNFTRDHLDFHGSMQAYWAAKARLFDWPGLQSAVVNVDDPQGRELAARLSQRASADPAAPDVWTVAIDAPARLRAERVQLTRSGLAFDVIERLSHGADSPALRVALPVVGRYNVHNLLGVLAAARALDVPLGQAVDACAALSAVPGRMEQAPSADTEPLVLVDYAHTPDALEKALQAVQPLAAHRGGALWVVVGCGGDRDATKRPLMAAVACQQAARVVLTSDNPRSEEPAAILRQMQAGVPAGHAVQVIEQRAEAIAHAVQTAAPADVVLIAGKGHEDYQEIRGVRHPFSDLQQATLALAAREVTR